MSVQMIPLHQLVASADNVRKTGVKTDVDALAASIAAHGLLQNLSVRARADNKFEVVAGARRHAALRSLAKAGTITRDFPVPCRLIDPKDAAEASLAENVQRVAMNAIDEAEAFKSLLDQGLDAEAIAQRFGANTRHVEQRLALAGLSAKVKAAYRRAEISLEALRAFCIEPDHNKQDAALRALGKPVTHAGQVRALLTQGSMKASDRLVRFIGIEVYEAAGGTVTRDLFDTETVFIADPALVTRLADERLESERQRLAADGWGWSEIVTGHLSQSAYSGQRIHPTRRSMTRSERKALQRLDGEIEALTQRLDQDEEEDDNLWQDREKLDAERRALIETTYVWDKDLIGLAGVAGAINHDGQLSLTYGIVAKADQAKLKRALGARAPEGAPAGDAAQPAEKKQADKLPKAVALDLTTVRAGAIRLGVADAPQLSLALTVFALAASARRDRVSAIQIETEMREQADMAEFERRRTALMTAMPADREELLEWCLAMEQPALLQTLAVLAAGALNLAHEDASAWDGAKQKFADRLANLLNLDMRRFWTADEAFFARLSKAMLLEIAANAPCLATKPHKRKALELGALAKLKRDDLAKAVAKKLKGAGYLPALLVSASSPQTSASQSLQAAA